MNDDDEEDGNGSEKYNLRIFVFLFDKLVLNDAHAV